MKNGMSLTDLLTEVKRQTEVKKDYVTTTQDNVRMVEVPEFEHKVGVVLLRAGASELQRFDITEQAHRQIAGRLSIPWKFYFRMLNDHRDKVIDLVNTLFEREPASRLMRTLDGKLRAFLSDRYLRLDNDKVLEQTLPAIVKGELPTQMLASNVSHDRMDLKVLFTGDELAQEVTHRTRTGQTRIIRPGFRLSNSETGKGSLKLEGFFYDGYCLNGCVFGKTEAFNLARRHVGARIIEGVDYEVLSDKSKELEDLTIVSQFSDAMKALADPAFAQAMGDKLRAAAATPDAQSPMATVDAAIKELPLREDERESILTTFLQDGDYTQWGLASAVTSVANKDETSYDRAYELEDVGAQILNLSLHQWNRLATAEPVQQAA